MKNNITFAGLMEVKQNLREKYSERLNLVFKLKEYERDARKGEFAQTLASEREMFNYLKYNLRFVNKQIKRLEDMLNNSKLI